MNIIYMWYKNAKILIAQALNIVGPSAPATQMPIEQAPQNVVTIPDQPAGVEEIPQPEPAGPQGSLPEPPLHDRCHCVVKTMPGGRRIWEANHNACIDCQNMEKTFNDEQVLIFGV